MTLGPSTPPDRRGDRLGAVDKQPLTPPSLVGSFFPFDAERSWQGWVVGEVAPGIYLVELFE